MFQPFTDIKEAKGEPSEAACLVLAGGQGTRLNYSGPKGTYPILNGISLFQLIAERVLATSPQSPVVILTAPHNDAATRAFFAQHNSFGLASSELSFVVQETLPFLDDAGKPLPIEGPAGNGHALHHLVQAGLVDQWEESGIQCVNVIPVDNPLAEPFDPELLTAVNGVDVAMKCTKRLHAEEKVGVLVSMEGHPQVIEYSELPESVKTAHSFDGELLYPWASLGLFCFSLPFVRKVATTNLPIHMARKPVTIAGQTVLAHKQERFLFDCLPLADTTRIIAADRSSCFSPLKNRSGEHSPESVRRALEARYREIRC